MRARKLFAAAAAIPLVVGAMGVAHADDVQNTVVKDGASSSTAAGGTLAVDYWIQTQGNDGQGGCNASDGTPVSFRINVPSGITASPTSLTFDACNKGVLSKTVSFSTTTATQPGGYNITVGNIHDAAIDGGSYVNLANWTLTVTAPSVGNTPPTVSVEGPVDGATYDKGEVPAASCAVTDAEDTNESAAPSIGGVTGPYAADGIGTQTVTCSYTDGGQLTRSASVTYQIVDPSAPTVTYTLNPATADGSDGWYRGNVTLTWHVSDTQSPNSVQKTGCVDQSITADQLEVTYTCSATSAGGPSGTVEAKIKRDGTAPSVSYDSVVSGTEGSNDWYTSDVTVRFNATDATSGVTPSWQTATTSGDGTAVTVSSPAFTDNAGNVRDAGAVTSPAFKIDSQAPNAPVVSVTPAPNGAGWHNADVLVSFAENGDNGPSGVADCTADEPVDVETTGRTVSGTCVDEAGNTSQSGSVTVKLDKTAPTDVAFVGGPAAGAKYFPNSVPAKPTCTADDSTSGLSSCVVTGYETAVGTHTLTATATDNAGNVTAVTRSYTVRNLTYSGFFAPVDRGIHNTIKGGNTVPLKFRVFDEGVEQTTTAVVKGFSAKLSSCTGVVGEDAIEEWATTGTTTLRYDTTAGHFVQNWKTPTKAGQCYTVAVTLIDDTAITAVFKTK